MVPDCLLWITEPEAVARELSRRWPHGPILYFLLFWGSLNICFVNKHGVSWPSSKGQGIVDTILRGPSVVEFPLNSVPVYKAAEAICLQRLPSALR